MPTGPTVTVVRIDADATTSRVVIARDDLQSWQDEIGGYFAPIYGDGWIALVDDEGERKDLPVNVAATVALRRVGYVLHILGRMLVTGPADAQGDFTDVNESVAQMFEQVAQRVRDGG